MQPIYSRLVTKIKEFLTKGGITMEDRVKRFYEIDKKVFQQFSMACAKLNITKTEGVNSALANFAEAILKQNDNK